MDERELLMNTQFHNLNRLVTTTKSGEWLCLVLELAEGVDLVAILRAYQKVPEDLVKLIILQVRGVGIIDYVVELYS